MKRKNDLDDWIKECIIKLIITVISLGVLIGAVTGFYILFINLFG